MNDPKTKFVLAEINSVDAPNFTMNVGEFKNLLPISDLNIKRIYYIDNAKGVMATSQHSHKDDESEIFIVLAGTAVAVIDDDGSGKREIPIKKNNIMWIPRTVWHGFINLSPDFVIMALTTTNYDPERKGYVTDYEEFKKAIK